MDGRRTWTDCDEAGDYVVPNVLSPRDLVSRPDIMDETVSHDSESFSSSVMGICEISLWISNITLPPSMVLSFLYTLNCRRWVRRLSRRFVGTIHKICTNGMLYKEN